MSIYFWFQFALLIAFLFISAPRGGMFLGLFSGIGLIVIMFGPKPWLGLPPGKPPVDVILTIIAVVAAGSTLQASGGLDCMLQIAEKILRKRPKVVTFLAPLCTFTLTILCGTGHTVYTLLPIIYDVAIKTGIRPDTSDGSFLYRCSDGCDLLSSVRRLRFYGRFDRRPSDGKRY